MRLGTQNHGDQKIAPLSHIAASVLAARHSWACRDRKRLDDTALERSHTDVARRLEYTVQDTLFRALALGLQTQVSDPLQVEDIAAHVQPPNDSSSSVVAVQTEPLADSAQTRNARFQDIVMYLRLGEVDTVRVQMLPGCLLLESSRPAHDTARSD